MRSAQPLLGSSSKRSKEDENLLKLALPMGKQGYIYDLRDSSILKSASAKGGGFQPRVFVASAPNLSLRPLSRQ